MYIQNYSYGPKWITVVIAETTGPVSYTVQTGDGRVMRRLVDQIRKRHAMLPRPEVMLEPNSLQSPEQVVEVLPTDSVVPTSVGGEATEPAPTAQVHPPAEDPPDARAEPSLMLLRSERTRQTPAYLKDFVR